MIKRRMVRRVLVGTLAATLGLVGLNAQALTRPGAVPTKGLITVVAAKSYAVWRLWIPRPGYVTFTFAGVTDGSADDAFIGGAGGGGGSGGGYSVIQAASNGVGAHLGLAIHLGGGTTYLYQAGTYWAVALIGGGTVPLGASIVKLKAPKGTTVKAFASGPAIELTDANFTSGGGHVVGSIAAGTASVHGSVKHAFKHGLFGLLFTNPGAEASYTDPNGTTSDVVGSVFWFNAARGTWTFHTDYDEPLEQRDYWGSNVTALLADIKLP